MAESRKGSQRHVRRTGSPRQEPSQPSVSEPVELVLTMDRDTHAVVKINRLDATGQRHDLSDKETAEVLGKGLVAELVGALDEAFQFGLAEGLGTRTEEEDVDDDVLLRLLVSGPTERDLRALGPRALLLRPLLLRRLLRHHISSVPDSEQQRRKPITQAPHNGSTSIV
jgi:hypothetical protein